MRTPVILVCGQGDTEVPAVLRRRAGTLVVEHRFDGHVVTRVVSYTHCGLITRATTVLELAHGCVSCTVRNDLLVYLRTLHRRADVERIVVRLAPWLEPEPVCRAIAEVPVHVGPNVPDGPAGDDVEVAAVIAVANGAQWLEAALGDAELDDGRTEAQVAVCQAEVADVVVLDEPQPTVLAVLRRLTPRARLTVGTERLELALANVDPSGRRGRFEDVHAPLLSGEPPLDSDGGVELIHFHARRPFHPRRLHDALDVLLEGVVRCRGRVWLATQPDRVHWLESAGGGLRVEPVDRWLAVTGYAGDVAAVSPERQVYAELLWRDDVGDRHVALTVLVCGADPDRVVATLGAALLTEAELAASQAWPTFEDPFGEMHDEPCGDREHAAADDAAAGRHGEEGSR